MSIDPAGDDEGNGGVVIVSSVGLFSMQVHQAHSNGDFVPRLLSAPSRFVNKDRRGVAIWGLFTSTSAQLRQRLEGVGTNGPLIDMEVLRQVRRQTGCRRRARNGLYGKVVRMRLLHGQVFEIEAIGTKVVHSPKRPTGR